MVEIGLWRPLVAIVVYAVAFYLHGRVGPPLTGLACVVRNERLPEIEGNLLNPRQPISLAQLLISWRSMCSCTRTPGLDMPMLRIA